MGIYSCCTDLSRSAAKTIVAPDAATALELYKDLVRRDEVARVPYMRHPRLEITVRNANDYFDSATEVLETHKER